MRLLKYLLILLSSLVMLPLAMAQELPAGGGPAIDITEPSSLQSIIEDYGCPVGIRDANRDLHINVDGLVEAGQRVLIPRESPLCEIEYYGEIEFFDWQSFMLTNSFPVTFWELAAYYNVCEDLLWELNPEWNYYSINSATARIPLDSPPCFETVELASGQTPQDLALEYNVCENIVWYYNDARIYEESSESRSVYLPLDRQGCYVDGQVLVLDFYPNQSEAYYVPAEIVQLDTPMYLRDFAIAENYCLSDIEDANRGKVIMTYRYERVYIPEGARRCIYLESPEKSLVEISREYNVCLESLIEVNGWVNSWSFIGRDSSVFLPSELPPCYDANGLRIAHDDRLVHETSKEEWLFGIAQQYGVCMADLFETNPLLENYPHVDLPSIIFIPDRPCSDVDEAGFVHHQVREADIQNYNYRWIAWQYNICEDEISQANSNRVLNGAMEIGETVLVPVGSRPCYDFQVPMAGVGHYHGLSQDAAIFISYICYAEEIDPQQDYTGHEPAISPVPESPDAHCYDRRANPYLVLDNVTYTLYPMYGDAMLFDVAACFGVDAYDIVALTDADLGITNSDYPTGVPHYWGIPNPTLDCPLIGTVRDAAINWLRIHREQIALGTLNENGEYGVQSGDTLSSIGRRYGYLPEWIMAENNLPDDTIFVHQKLRLPSYPNLYQIGTYAGAIGGGLVLFLGASFALRLRAKGRKGKKKNDE